MNILLKYIFLPGLIILSICSCKQDKVEQKVSSNKILNDHNLILINDDIELINYAISTRFPNDTLPEYYKRSGFIHPLKTLDGTTITDGFPVGHTHQHGLFSAWTSTTFRGKQLDFWNQAKEEAIVRHKDILEDQSTNSFKTEMEYIVISNGDSIVALNETWEMELMKRKEYYIIDWQIEQSGNGMDSLVLNKYHYGGPAFRGSAKWNVENNYDSICFFTTNEGLDHIAANHTRPLWASMYGDIDNAVAGIGIIQGKENVRYPQHIRVHPSMPYYCFIPTVNEPFTIGPKDEIVSNFRLVVFDGKVNADVMNKEMKDFNSTFE